MAKKSSKSSLKKAPRPPFRSSLLSPPFLGLNPPNPYNAPPEPGHIGWKFDPHIAAPWELLGCLNLWNIQQMRRVMSMLDDPLNIKSKTPEEVRWSSNRRHRWERAIVRRIMNEAKGNYLLYQMLLWFGNHWNKTDKDVDRAINTLSEWATIQVRRRKLFLFDYKATKVKWQEFIGSGWKFGADIEQSTDLVGPADHRNSDYRERLQRHLATFEVIYFPETILKDDHGYTTEEDAPEDLCEPEDIIIPQKLPKSTGRTRSGKVRYDEDGWQIKPDAMFQGLPKQKDQDREKTLKIKKQPAADEVMAYGLSPTPTLPSLPTEASLPTEPSLPAVATMDREPRYVEPLEPPIPFKRSQTPQPPRMPDATTSQDQDSASCASQYPELKSGAAVTPPMIPVAHMESRASAGSKVVLGTRIHTPQADLLEALFNSVPTFPPTRPPCINKHNPSCLPRDESQHKAKPSLPVKFRRSPAVLGTSIHMPDAPLLELLKFEQPEQTHATQFQDPYTFMTSSNMREQGKKEEIGKNPGVLGHRIKQEINVAEAGPRFPPHTTTGPVDNDLFNHTPLSPESQAPSKR